MPKYLVTASYTAEGAKGLLKDGGSKRRQAIEGALKAVGGKVESFYFALGKDDVYAIGGAVTQTTVLLTPEELDQATQKKPNYVPPGQ